jgi:hypothetical protein
VRFFARTHGLATPRSPAPRQVPAVKCCCRCTRWKQAREFYRDARNRDGLAGSCKACQIDAANAWARRKHAASQRARRNAFGTLMRTLTSLREAGANLAELSAYTGIAPHAIEHILRGEPVGAFHHRMTRDELHHLTGGRCGR